MSEVIIMMMDAIVYCSKYLVAPHAVQASPLSADGNSWSFFCCSDFVGWEVMTLQVDLHCGNFFPTWRRQRRVPQ